MTYWETLDHDETPRTANDGRTLVAVSVGLAIAGIIVPIVGSIAAIVTAIIARKRLAAGEDTARLRAWANTALVFSVLDMAGYVALISVLVVGIRS